MTVTARQRMARKQFQASGYTLTGACVIVGNLVQESRANLDSTVERGRSADHGSGGIAEWRLERKDNLKSFAAMRGKDPNDLVVQCDFLAHELQTDYPGLDRQLRGTERSVETLTANFCWQFERPSRRLRPDGTSIANLDGRIKFAKENLADARKDVAANGGAVVAVGTGASGFFLGVQQHPYLSLALLAAAILIGIAVLWAMRRPAEPAGGQEGSPASPSRIDKLRAAQELVRDAIEARDALINEIKAEANEIQELLAMAPAAAVSIEHVPVEIAKD